MVIDLQKNNRFKWSDVVDRNGKTVFSRWVMPDFMKEDLIAREKISSFYVTSDLAGRPDLIADQIYGSPNLEWVITMFNAPRETLGWPKTGEVIKIINAGLVLVNV